MIVIWGLSGVIITAYLFSFGIHLNHLNMLFDFCTFWEQSLIRGCIRHCLIYNHYIFNNYTVYVFPEKYTCQIFIKITCCYFQYLVCPIEVSVFSTTGQ